MINFRLNPSYNNQNLKCLRSSFNMANIRHKTSKPAFSYLSPTHSDSALSVWRDSKFWNLFGLLSLFGGTTYLIYEWTGLSESLRVEEYVSNAALIQAQRNAKDANDLGQAPISKLDKFMISIPDLNPSKGYRIKTPGGHYAFYYEDEEGEPFLLDDANNLWIWAGTDSEKPADDWLVRTPNGDVYNYFIDATGTLKQNLLGNEREIRAITNTNLGTIVAFAHNGIDDLRYQELPISSLDSYSVPESGEQLYLPPPLLEEGFMEFFQKKKLVNRIPYFHKNTPAVEYEEINDSIRHSGENFLIKTNPFLTLINTEEEDMIDVLQENGQITPIEASKIKLELANEIKDEIETTIKGIDVAHIPSAFDSFVSRGETTGDGYNPDIIGYLPGRIQNDN